MAKSITSSTQYLSTQYLFVACHYNCSRQMKFSKCMNVKHTHTHSFKRFKKALIFQLHFIAMYFVNANFPNKKLVATQAFAISRLKNQTTKSSTSPNRYKMSIRSKTSLLKLVYQRANLFVPYSMQVTTVHSYNC